jgi:hypothetical protein
VSATRGTCRYAFNPSEIYQRAKPGQGVEITCGAQTWPANDEPEVAAIRRPDDTFEYRPTGRVLARAQPDPYCPRHGGSPEPPPPPVDATDVQYAYAQLASVVQRFQAQAAPAAAPAGELPPAAPVSEAGFADWMDRLMAAHQPPPEVTDGQE